MFIRIAVAAFWLCLVSVVLGSVLPNEILWIAAIVLLNPIAAIPGFVSGWRNEWGTAFPIASIIGSLHAAAFFVMQISAGPGLLAALFAAAVTVAWAGIGIKAREFHLRRRSVDGPSPPPALQVDEAEIPY